jgi:predicted lysophospholipase L1 biosynthesis ABC-type transport system permease subunit
LRDHHLHIGDVVSLTAGGPPVRIVGTAAIPAQEGGEFGFVAWLGAGAFDRLGVEASGQYLYVTIAPGARTDQLERAIVGDRPTAELDQFARLGGPAPPPNFANLRQIGGLPYLLAAFLGLLGLASLVHALLIAVRARRRDLAVLRSLGFVRGQVVGTIAWQATTTTLVGIIVGVPAGLVVGSWVWRRLASSLGTGPDVSVPLVVLGGVAAAALLAAYLIALVPARYASHLRPADVLRTE